MCKKPKYELWGGDAPIGPLKYALAISEQNINFDYCTQRWTRKRGNYIHKHRINVKTIDFGDSANLRSVIITVVGAMECNNVKQKKRKNNNNNNNGHPSSVLYECGELKISPLSRDHNIIIIIILLL